MSETSSTDKLAVRVTDLTVAYHHRPVLWDIDLEVPAGKLMAVMGPNGAGKTTMIKAILGLVPTAAGRVQILGKPYPQQRHLVGYVPQRGSVDWDFPTTVRDVVMMGRYGALNWFKRPGANERKLAAEALEKVGMNEFADRQISQLSGGQQQRVFLARALVQDAQIYFMDEPFQGVDARTERAIVDLLKELRADGPHRGRGAPRSADGEGIFRLDHLAERAAHCLRAGQCGVQSGELAAGLRRTGGVPGGPDPARAR